METCIKFVGIVDRTLANQVSINRANYQCLCLWSREFEIKKKKNRNICGFQRVYGRRKLVEDK